MATEDCMSKPNYKEELDSISTLKVHITVNDVNDNSPQFVSKIFTGGVTTEADFGIEFMNVKVSENYINILNKYLLCIVLFFGSFTSLNM